MYSTYSTNKKAQKKGQNKPRVNGSPIFDLLTYLTG